MTRKVISEHFRNATVKACSVYASGMGETKSQLGWMAEQLRVCVVAGYFPVMGEEDAHPSCLCETSIVIFLVWVSASLQNWQIFENDTNTFSLSSCAIHMLQIIVNKIKRGHEVFVSERLIFEKKKKKPYQKP